MAALTWRGAQSENPLLTDLKPGLDAVRSGDYAAARVALSALTDKYPDAIEVHYYLGVSRLFLNDGTAIASLDRAARLADASLRPDVSWYLAVAHERAGNASEARRQLTTLCGGESPRAQEACEGLKRLK
jgi:hypothetical protein